MKINEFPATLALPLGAKSQVLECRVGLRSPAGRDVVEAVREVFSSFVQACNLGMLSGEKLPPELARVGLVESSAREGLMTFRLTMDHVPVESCRVLIGMLRGQVLLDGVVQTVEVAAHPAAGEPSSVSVASERTLPLPALASAISFEYNRPRSMRATDRGVRVTFERPLAEDVVIHLAGIQSVWQSICEGGLCAQGVEPFECGMLAEPGLRVAAGVFEIKIAVFSNQEQCFDCFANAIERVSRTLQRVTHLEVW